MPAAVMLALRLLAAPAPTRRPPSRAAPTSRQTH